MTVDYSNAFVDGFAVETDYGPSTLRIHRIGDLAVPTGFLVACDPFVNFDATPFSSPVPPGTFPVELSVVDFGDGDQRVAFARVRVNESIPVSWRMALTEGQDPKSLEDGHFFGYPVDSGTGCFMDAETSVHFDKKLDDSSYTDLMMAEMEKNYRHTWDWANFSFDGTSGNLITFKSGLGDGVYPSFFGHDDQGRIAELLTDFIVIDLY